MLSIRLQFLSGRYHANPWNRHVNEAEIAWPPDAWRFCRALIATWFQKVKASETHSDQAFTRLIELLSEACPEYVLPSASHSHTRHFMPKRKLNDKTLIFDAFVALDRNSALYMVWPDLELPSEQLGLLDDLLAGMNYLGRSESWVEARRASTTLDTNCRPGEITLNQETGELLGEIVSLNCPIPAKTYHAFRHQKLKDKQQMKQLGETLPNSLTEAIATETAALQKRGWSQPPAAQKVNYIRPLETLRPRRQTKEISIGRATTACFLLLGKPLPRVEDTIRIGEVSRNAVMHLYDNQPIPAKFSGHGMDKDVQHQHAFYLPWDSDNDGYLDRIVVHVPAGIDEAQRRMLEKLRKVWLRNKGQWDLLLEGIGMEDICGGLSTASRNWISITPYLHPWHRKKHFTMEQQIHDECKKRRFPAIRNIERLNHILVGTSHKKPVHFHRFRNKTGLMQPDRSGSLWSIEFEKPFSGPLALGFGCHYGLGLFQPFRS